VITLAPRSVKLAVAVALAIAALGCESAPARRSPPPGDPAGAHVEELSPEQLDRDPIPPPVADPPSMPIEAPAAEGARPIERAPASDEANGSDAPVRARRYVYRVRLLVPEMLGENRSDLARSAAELFVDVSGDRLRARFVGQGWPVEAGSEIRVRGDSPGVYVFDRDGGRSLAPGAMSEWFEGGPRNRTGPPLMVRRDPNRGREEVPGALICALLAEWAAEPRESVARRCETGAPLGFRVGLWRGERTADVPVELPARALRADEADPPAPIPGSTSRAFLEPSALARVPEMEHAPRDLVAPAGGPAEGLEFVNESEARVVVTIEGIAAGWVDSGARGLFVGLRPGAYRIAALRPLGAVVIRPRIVPVPGRTVLGAPRHPRESIVPR
jgi:hypothetical protein